MSEKVQYVLGVDGGGTKTVAKLIQLDTEQEWHADGGATSLTNDFPLALENITSICEQLMTRAGCMAAQVSAVFGLAGACDKKRANTLRQKLNMCFSRLDIVTDAKTSLYGANGGLPIAVVALGTGSVGMRLLENGNEALVGGWGFVPGDEGGGAKLGLLAVQQLLHEIDSKCGINSPLSEFISKEVGAERQAILGWLAKAKPADFAVFTREIFALKSKCVVASAVIQRHLVDVEKLILLTVADTNLPLVLMGGLADATKNMLSEDVLRRVVDAKGDSLDGACLLARKLSKSL